MDLNYTRRDDIWRATSPVSTWQILFTLTSQGATPARSQCTCLRGAAGIADAGSVGNGRSTVALGRASDVGLCHDDHSAGGNGLAKRRVKPLDARPRGPGYQRAWLPNKKNGTGGLVLRQTTRPVGRSRYFSGAEVRDLIRAGAYLGLKRSPVVAAGG